MPSSDYKSPVTKAQKDAFKELFKIPETRHCGPGMKKCDRCSGLGSLSKHSDPCHKCKGTGEVPYV